MTAKRILINYLRRGEKPYSEFWYFPKIVVVNFVWFLSLDLHAHVHTCSGVKNGTKPINLVKVY